MPQDERRQLLPEKGEEDEGGELEEQWVLLEVCGDPRHFGVSLVGKGARDIPLDPLVIGVHNV